MNRFLLMADTLCMVLVCSHYLLMPLSYLTTAIYAWIYFEWVESHYGDGTMRRCLS